VYGCRSLLTRALHSIVQQQVLLCVDVRLCCVNAELLCVYTGLFCAKVRLICVNAKLFCSFDKSFEFNNAAASALLCECRALWHITAGRALLVSSGLLCAYVGLFLCIQGCCVRMQGSFDKISTFNSAAGSALLA